MKSIDKSPRVSSPEWSLPGCVDYSIINIVIYGKNKFHKNPFYKKKMKSIDKSPWVSSPEWPLPGCVDYSIINIVIYGKIYFKKKMKSIDK